MTMASAQPASLGSAPIQLRPVANNQTKAQAATPRVRALESCRSRISCSVHKASHIRRTMLCIGKMPSLFVERFYAVFQVS